MSARVRWLLLLLPLFAVAVAIHGWIALCHGEQSTDTAINVQFLTLALFEGWAPSGLLGVTAFGDHVDPLLILPAPVFALAPSAWTLQAVKAAALLGGVPAVAQLAGRRLGPGGARVAVFAYLVGPLFWLSVVADYHVETLAAALIPWLLLAYDRERLGACLGLALLVALGKENLPLVIGGLGILAWSDGRDVRWWGSLCALGAVVFLLGVFVILPACAPPGGAHHTAFTPLRTSAGWRAALLRLSLYKWLGLLLLSCAALPLLRLRAAWPLLPLLLQHGLSGRESERAFDYHYLAPVLPLLAYAAIRGAERLESRPRALGVALGVVSLALLLGLGPGHRLRTLRPEHGAAALARGLPPDQPVWVSRSTAARLSTRHPIYLLECLTLGSYPDRPGWPFTPPDPLPLVGLVDARDGPFLKLPPGVTALEASGDLLRLGPGEQSPIARRLPSDAAFEGEWASAPGDIPVRVQAGDEGCYRVAIDRPLALLPTVQLLLERHDGSRDARVHRLGLGLTRGSGAWEVRYTPPAFASAGPVLATLYLKWHPADDRALKLTTYSGKPLSQAAVSSGGR